MIAFSPARGADASVTLVQQLVDAVTTAIEQQRLGPGMALPSIRDCAREHGISTFNVSASYQRLVSQGWLIARPGAGYRVAPKRTMGALPPAATPWEAPRVSSGWLLSDIFADHSIPIKAGCGWLPGEWLNETGMHHALRQIARVPATQMAGYGHPYGYAPLREAIAGSLATAGMAVDAQQLVLTQGVTHGLDLVARTLLRPGDTVIVEQPCYTNLLQLLRLSGLRIVTVARTAAGLDIDALTRIGALHEARALFVNTVLQNPTGSSVTMANAFRILQWAEQHGVWVIEDGISRELSDGPTPLLGALDGAQRVLSLGGFSKTISPSVRVGYIAGHRDVLRDVARTKMAVGLTSPEIMERVVHRVLTDGHYSAHVAHARERLTLAHAEVGRRMHECGLTLWGEPQSGLFLWARLGGRWRGQGAKALAEQALQAGIWLAPGAYFEASEADTDWVRFNVAYSESPALWDFLRRAGATGAPQP